MGSESAEITGFLARRGPLPRCYRNATHADKVRTFHLRSTELMTDSPAAGFRLAAGLRSTVLSLTVKESRHASLHSSSRGGDAVGGLSRLCGRAADVCAGRRAALEH